MSHDVSITELASQRPNLALRSFAFDRLGAMTTVLDSSGTIIDTNEAWRLFARLNDGPTETTGLGVNYLDACDRAARAGAADAAAAAAGLRQILAGEREQFDLDYPCPSPTEDRWFMLQASSAPVDGGAGVVLFHVDITARTLRECRLTGLAEDDALTGLPNRRAAMRFIEEQLAVARGRHELWALFLDLDGFKDVNDRHGHHAGDELLVHFAARARRVVRAADRLFRLGGDEFVLVCPDLGDEHAEVLAARLREVTAQPFQLGAHVVRVGASVGIASSHRDSTVSSLLAAADVGMYADKRRRTGPGAPHGATGTP